MSTVYDNGKSVSFKS